MRQRRSARARAGGALLRTHPYTLHALAHHPAPPPPPRQVTELPFLEPFAGRLRLYTEQLVGCMEGLAAMVADGDATPPPEQ